MRKDSSARVALVSPVLVDGGAHFLALSDAEVEAGCSYMIMDLRRVVHPPFVTFWTTRAVTQFSVAHIEDILLAEFPSVAPVVNVFVDDIRADTVVLARRFPLVTVMGVPHDSRHLGRLPEPALHFTRDLLMARPGHYSRSMRVSCALRPPSGCTTVTTTGMDSQSRPLSVPRSLAPPLPTASGNSGASPAAGSFASSRASPVLRSDWQALYFTVLDPDMQMRFLEKKRGWSDADCVREASRLSRHLPTPHRVSVVARPFVSLPVPQIVLSPHQRFPTSRSVAVDLRPLGRSVCVLDLAFGESLFAGFMLECRRTGSGEILSRIARGEVGISVLGAMSDAFRPVPLEAASVHTFVWDRPVEQHGAPGADLPEDPLEEVSSRSLAEVALQIADPPWFRVTIHLPDMSQQRVSPSALFTQAPTAISLRELTGLASEYVALFRSHSALRLHVPAFTPVGSGSLLHVLAECNASLDAGHTMALFDGRELDSRTPAVYSALLPCPFSLCEVAAASRDLWPDRPAAASFLVNGQPVDSLKDFTTSCPLVQPMPRVPLPPDIRPPPFRPVPTHAVLSRLPGFTEADIGSVSAFTPTTTSSTTTGPCALPVSVRIAFALPGQRAKSVPLLAGGHLADSLWDLLSAPACSYDFPAALESCRLPKGLSRGLWRQVGLVYFGHS